jgi:hypothetical protein
MHAGTMQRSTGAEAQPAHANASPTATKAAVRPHRSSNVMAVRPMASALGSQTGLFDHSEKNGAALARCPFGKAERIDRESATRHVEVAVELRMATVTQRHHQMRVDASR